MSSQILKYKDAYFYSYIKSLIKEYATKHQDRILMKYVESDSLKTDEMPCIPSSILVRPFFRNPSQNNFKNNGFLNSGRSRGTDGKAIFEFLKNNLTALKLLLSKPLWVKDANSFCHSSPSIALV